MLRSLTLALFATAALALPAMAENAEIPVAPPGVRDPGPGIQAPRARPRARAAARNLTPEQRVARVNQRCAQAGDNPRRARFCQRWQGMSQDQRAAFIDRAVQRAAQRRQRQPA